METHGHEPGKTRLEMPHHPHPELSVEFNLLIFYTFPKEKLTEELFFFCKTLKDKETAIVIKLKVLCVIFECMRYICV